MRNVAISLMVLALFSIGYSPARSADLTSLKKSILLYLNCDQGVKTRSDVIFHGDLRYEPGKFKQAVRLERRWGVNLLENPDFDKGLTGWFMIGSPRLLKEGGFSSPSCVEIAQGSFIRQTLTNLKGGQAYCFSIYARGEKSKLTVQLKSADKRVQVQDFETSRDYQRISIGIVVPSEDCIITIKSVTGVVTVDAAQLESGKTFPSSFFPRKEPKPHQLIELVPSPALYNPMTGTIACWVNLDGIGAEYGGGCALWGFGDYPPDKPWTQNTNSNIGSYWICKGQQDYSNRFGLTFIDQDSKLESYTGPTLEELSPQTWHHVALTWDIRPGGLSQSSFFLDGKETATKKEMHFGEFRIPKVMNLGYSGGGYLDGLLDEFVIFNRALSSEEVRTLYQQVAPLSD